jgi:DNA polymerase III alpha subunit (gram-positive type)
MKVVVLKLPVVKLKKNKMRTIIFDFETNGLLSKPDCQPVEFSCLVIKGDIIKEQDVLIKCAGTIDEKAIETHGITKEMLDKDGIEYEIFLKGLDQILFHKENFRIVGHNIINFDIPLAEKILNKQINKNLIFDTAAYFKNELMGYEASFSNNYKYQKEVLEQRIKGLYFNLKAATLHYKTELVEGNAHRAMNDVKNTYNVYKKQYDKYTNSPAF